MPYEMLRAQHFVVGNHGSRMLEKGWGLPGTELATGFGKKPPAMTWKAERGGKSSPSCPCGNSAFSL